MARKRTALAPALEADLIARTARGETSDMIAASIGGVLSERTIRRRQRELRAGTNTRANEKSRDEKRTRRVETRSERDENEKRSERDESEEDLPENAKPEDIDHWLRKLERLADIAEAQGNLSALASIAAKVATLMHLKHKTAPLPKEDPNEREDMRDLGAEVEKRFLALIHDAFHPCEGS